MRAIDTNLLVRFFTSDDVRQTAAVERFLTDCGKNREAVFVSIVVICELSWVLSVSYRFAKGDIVDALTRLVKEPLFRVENEPLVQRALALYRIGRGGLADYVIGELAAAAGCRDTVTFDRRLREAQGFTLL